ncbi:MAG: hypothetical protein GEV06_05135 [Luteitalea sp.]|nr:hypothetical protein [Luteitalea sp.]
MAHRLALRVIIGAGLAAGMLASLSLVPPGGSPSARAQPQPGGASSATIRAQTREGHARSPRNASYAIDVTLLPSRRLLEGREVITWRNITSSPTSELRLHLYYNAWRNTRSSWLRERELGDLIEPSDLADLTADEWGWSDVRAVRLFGAAPPVDLTRQITFISPDDGNREDRTLLRVPLPAPVAPGGTVNLEVEWRAQVSRTFARTGARGNYFFLSHWFPKIGVLTEDGWNAHQFHSTTEFFADYGTYDVRVRAPRGWAVGATGRAIGVRENGETTTHRFLGEDVHDFAWTTSPDFVERRARFEHARLPPVEMRLLLQPEHVHQADRHFAATRAALRYYGEWYGPYPYDHLTIVDPAWESGSGGMEYPTLFTSGTRWLQPQRSGSPEGVTVHECGHQFWYGVVGSNEFEDAWLDEGLNTFSTSRVMTIAFPRYETLRFFGSFVPWLIRDLPISRLGAHGLDRYRTDAESDVPETPTWRYFPATHATITYSKTALWLETLERYLGWPTLQKILSTYFSRYSFKHPTPADFFAVANEVSGRNLGWFFDQVYRSSNVFDYGVQDVQSEADPKRGFVEGPQGLAFQEEPPDPRGRYRTRVVVRRYGEGIFPVDVVVTFADDQRVREQWDGRDRWRAYVYARPSQVVSVRVDPERVLALDVNYTNNSWSAEPQAEAAARRWSLTWLTWLQDLLLTYGFFV